MVSIREVDRKYREKFDGEVPSEIKKLTKKKGEEFLDEFVESVVEEFHEVNRFRKIQHRKKLNRIPVSLFKSFLQRVQKQRQDFLIEGSGAQLSNDTSLSYKADIEVV